MHLEFRWVKSNATLEERRAELLTAATAPSKEGPYRRHEGQGGWGAEDGGAPDEVWTQRWPVREQRPPREWIDAIPIARLLPQLRKQAEAWIDGAALREKRRARHYRNGRQMLRRTRPDRQPYPRLYPPII